MIIFKINYIQLQSSLEYLGMWNPICFFSFSNTLLRAHVKTQSVAHDLIVMKIKNQHSNSKVYPIQIFLKPLNFVKCTV